MFYTQSCSRDNVVDCFVHDEAEGTHVCAHACRVRDIEKFDVFARIPGISILRFCYLRKRKSGGEPVEDLPVYRFRGGFHLRLHVSFFLCLHNKRQIVLFP